MVERAKQLGSRVIVDLCDDHFDSPELGPAYQSLCRLADRVVASTNAMAELICQRTGRTATVIDDPFEGPLGSPRFAPRGEQVRLLWFGHPVNFDTVAAMMPGLVRLSREAAALLHVVSAAGAGDIARVLEPCQWSAPPVRSVTRSRRGVLRLRGRRFWNAIWSWCRACPMQKSWSKVPNRVVEPLRSGRFVVAYPLPSYQELGDYLWLGEDMAAGIEWAISNPAEVLDRIDCGQAYINRRFAPSNWRLAMGRRIRAVGRVRPSGRVTLQCFRAGAA